MDARSYAVTYSPGPLWTEGITTQRQPLADHVQHLLQLYRRRKLIIGGPFVEDDGGVIILRVESDHEARTCVETDPAVADGRLNAEIRPFRQAFPKAAWKARQRRNLRSPGDGHE